MESVTKKIALFKVRRERKSNTVRISSRRLILNPIVQQERTSIANIIIPACMVAYKSVLKNLIIQSKEGKRNGQIQEE